MKNEITLEKNELSSIEIGKTFSREDILDFEKKIKKVDGAVLGDSKLCPLKHSFSHGIYVREISIPKGMIIVGKIHKHEHPNFLLKGKVKVITEEGEEIITAPCSMISKPGTKRALHALTDLVWTTIHHNPTNTQDLAKLEKIIIAQSYEEFEKHLKKGKSALNKIKKSFIKILSK